ncbi:MAG TPA: YraN family protein [Bacteroidales bacterium]|jgi:putative endonuclease|nr:YraN family protein [Bacteroidales bacterium]
MSESQSLGEKGENYAAEYLKKKGYTIRNRNWKSGKKELDIVAENEDFIVFVEVKTRSSDFQVHPRDAVTREKQRSVIFAADWYIRMYNINKESRFDIITVIEREGTFDIDHIENAFYPTLR